MLTFDKRMILTRLQAFFPIRFYEVKLHLRRAYVQAMGLRLPNIMS